MKSLAKIQTIFERYTTSYHFYLRDLRTGEEFELGQKKKYPICSCFKLAVLMAYFDSVEDICDLNEMVTIRPEQFSPGGGLINFFDSDVKFSRLQLAQLMISFSDSTATDYLVAKVGLLRVNEILTEASPESSINMNLSEMIAHFASIPNSKRLKVSAPEQNFDPLVEKLNLAGTTNGKDLANLSLKSFGFKTKPELSAYYRRCLQINRSQPRSNLFLEPALKFYGKTGSLGFGYFTNDCGVLYDSANDKIVATLGFSSYGWKIEKDAIEGVCGLIGVEAIKLLNLEPILNQRWGQKVESHLLGYEDEV